MKESGTQKKNPALEPLEVLVGSWKIEISAASFLPNSSARLSNQATIEWIEEGDFLRMRLGERSVGLPYANSIIGKDEAAETYVVLYTDDRKVSRVYQMSFKDGEWKQWRMAPGFSQRFLGTFADNGNTINATWEKSFDGTNWEHDFNITYTKVK